MTFRDAARLCIGGTAGEILGRGFFQLPIDKKVPLGSPSPFWEIGFGVPLNFTTTILEEGGGPGPYGAKGMGKGGILAVAPAI